ncbi:hypothetical protein KUTeg_020425 [Tegillarca granosa]|uniref:Uncharacterized protein n=1 Tax=Tegillarca granosa TaxID=220873 RepID=A0ABQ9EDV3_TEGGR|nr:hypothetical protein KUTeg_020425 [Tegillarca granosa]
MLLRKFTKPKMRVPVFWIFTVSVIFCVLCSLVIAKKEEHNIEERDTEVAEVLQLEHDLKRVKRLQDFRDQEQELERVKRLKV